MAETKIEWTEKTWNPITGCTPISPGCAHCYARRMAKRLAGRCGYPESPHEFDVTLHQERLGEPLRWRKPAKVFVCSMSDLFHEGVPFEFIDMVMAVIGRSQQHTFQILTKRPERMAEYFGQDRYDSILREALTLRYRPEGMGQGISNPSRFGLPNVWLGVTAENQEQADRRIPILLEIPAAIRFVSIEPMLEPVNLRAIRHGSFHIDAITGRHHHGTWYGEAPHSSIPLNLVICGGESGPGARPMHPAWARSLRDHCAEAGVPFFFKQWGEWHEVSYADGHYWIGEELVYPKSVKFCKDVVLGKVGKRRAGRLLDGREWNEYPNSERG